HDVDLRVSSVPSTWGESLVIRLLRKQTELPDLAGLGLDGRTSEVLQRILTLPNGVFLVTGPTGSGKSTTLYRGLELINDGQRKIITIEDPVEYDVESITQIQVRSEIGYDFANGLRAILRQDPDVIMVGEIRDQETATIAAQAALTGHFVLSTLHTNSAIAAITRLKDIGLE
ncbi:MAG: ATPase, T2SS/T4P/T4SS family, partial [Myxococcota bacterium]